MVAQFRASPSSFHAHHLDFPVRDEIIKKADGVAAAAHAGEKRVRQPSNFRPHLAASFLPDYPLKLAHHERIRMRPQHRAQQVMRVLHVRHPIAHGLVNSIFERLAAGGNSNHLCTQQAHAEDVGRLPRHVLFAHVDDAFKAQ